MNGTSQGDVSNVNGRESDKNDDIVLKTLIHEILLVFK